MNYKKGELIYFIGTGCKAIFIETILDTDGEYRCAIEFDGKIKKYHISHFTSRPIFTKYKHEISNKNWLKVSGQTDGKCSTYECSNISGTTMHCDSCKKNRKEYFKKKYFDEK